MLSSEFKSMKIMTKLVYIVATLALLNWFTFKVFNYNFIDKIFDLLNFSAYTIWIYWIIGLMGGYAVYKIFK